MSTHVYCPTNDPLELKHFQDKGMVEYSSWNDCFFLVVLMTVLTIATSFATWFLHQAKSTGATAFKDTKKFETLTGFGNENRTKGKSSKWAKVEVVS